MLAFPLHVKTINIVRRNIPTLKQRSFLLATLFVLVTLPSVLAQRPLKVMGKVMESGKGEVVPFATVVIKDKASDELITGTTTTLNGAFTIPTTARNFYVEVSFLGFKTERIDDIQVSDGQVNLGTIMIAEDSALLDEVVVSAERSRTEFQIDKRVFNVGNDISSTGMGALEVLNKVPSVNVNIEGEVSLRGSTGVQILIDGKPSILADDPSNALGAVTADMIEKIEVITNPSAKYDAEGTSGILNIVLKKEEKKGLNGSISVNTGVPDNHSIGVSLNRRTEKFNLFTQFGMGYRSLPRDTENLNVDLEENTELLSIGENFRNEMFYNMTLGTDYHINKQNVITLSGNFAYEVEDQPADTYFSFFNAAGELQDEWKRTAETEATNPKWQYELQYKKDFKNHKEHDLIISALGRSFSKDQSSYFTEEIFTGSPDVDDQETRTNFMQNDYTFKVDYVDPITENFTLETGAQYVINDVGNDFAVYDLTESGVFAVDSSQTNNFEFDQRVLGVYSTSAFKWDKFGLKVGLRVENTNLQTLLVTTDEANDRNYTNLFPSAHASFKFSEAFSVQGGYSRRIYRPRLWDLNPFFNIVNNFNIRQGNPNLNPEFTDSYEVTGVYVIGKAAINAGIYVRRTTDVIERISTFQDNVTTTLPLNIGSNNTTGLEVNVDYDVAKWFSLNGDVNYNYFSRVGSFENEVFDFEGDRATARVTSMFKLKKAFDLELTGNYRSGYVTVQGDVSANTFLDIGLRKGFMKKKAVMSIGVRDVFASRFDESTTNEEDFYLYSFRQRGRFITLGFSYGFGKGEAMTYSGGRRRR